MTPEEFLAIKQWAAGRVRKHRPERVVLDGTEPSTTTSAVYVAYDTKKTCLYVGSVHRPGHARPAAERLSEHDVLFPRWSTWAVLYVVPIITAATLSDVRSIEGYAGLILRPTQNRRLPIARTLVPLDDPASAA